jgi:uncharacterized protein YkwD
MAHARPASLLAFLAAFAAACVAVLASPVIPTASARGCGSATDANPADLAPKDARDAIVCLLNHERQDAGLGSLDENDKLQRAAQRHNEKMDGTGCFDHACSGEGDLGRRLESVGYLGNGLSRWAYGENIAWGSADKGSPRAIVDAWMHSPGHRSNILSRTFRDIGVGFSAGTPSRGRGSGGIYTTDFGLRVG